MHERQNSVTSGLQRHVEVFADRRGLGHGLGDIELHVLWVRTRVANAFDAIDLANGAVNVTTGLGSRFGTELLKRGFQGRYNNIGTNKEGSGGLWQQMGYQGIDSDGILDAMKSLLS